MVSTLWTWKCDICGDTRPDDQISVLTKDLVINGQVVGKQNVKYCNDRDSCKELAKDFSFFRASEDYNLPGGKK